MSSSLRFCLSSRIVFKSRQGVGYRIKEKVSCCCRRYAFLCLRGLMYILKASGVGEMDGGRTEEGEGEFG